MEEIRRDTAQAKWIGSIIREGRKAGETERRGKGGKWEAVMKRQQGKCRIE